MKNQNMVDEYLGILNKQVDSIVDLFSAKNDFSNCVYSKWTPKNILAHIVTWNESFARNINDIVNDKKPIPLKGSLSAINENGVLEKEKFSIRELLEQLIRAQKIINKQIFSNKILLIPYKKGSRDYSKEEHLEVVSRHIKGHYLDLIKMLTKDVINGIREDLEKNIDPAYRENANYGFKEKVKFLGVKTPIVGKLATQHFKNIRNLSKKEIFVLCEKLWQSGYMEDSFIACNWSYAIHKQYEQKDFEVFEKWVKNYISNWATCDTFCNHTVGTYVEMYPNHVSNLKKWAKSKNRWMRRASAVSLIIPARHGKFMKDIFGIADILLLDQDDLVQKGYGWMLKVASQTHQKEVFNYIIKNKTKMPRTALRYAIEKMPTSLKKRAMIK